ncbi:MAG: carboxypeptidase-like regulatory domain-containing protein [Kofleriaceae bacterium]
MRSLMIGWLWLLCASCSPPHRTASSDEALADAIVHDVAPACPTAITGTVYAPNGTLPLYDVRVYVPLSDPGPLTEGVTCERCSASVPGGALATATTDARGRFRLEGVPPDRSFPLVIATGKWRRQLTMPAVAACTDTEFPSGTFRLPRNRSEGDIPRIAVALGSCDPLACVLTKLGIDSSEFGDSSSGPQRVVFYATDTPHPGSPQPTQSLWGNLDELKKFDMVINSCECGEYNSNKTSPDVLRQYADIGGRVYGSHYHYTWARNLIPAWTATASWEGGAYEVGDPALVDTSTADGEAFAEWLVETGASTVYGEVPLVMRTNDVSTVVPPTQRWLYSRTVGTGPQTTDFLSFETPVGAASGEHCGKVVHAGMHVSAGYVDSNFPVSCTAELTPNEKALVFLLFDLGSCIDIIL